MQRTVLFIFRSFLLCSTKKRMNHKNVHSILSSGVDTSSIGVNVYNFVFNRLIDVRDSLICRRKHDKTCLQSILKHNLGIKWQFWKGSVPHTKRTFGDELFDWNHHVIGFVKNISHCRRPSLSDLTTELSNFVNWEVKKHSGRQWQFAAKLLSKFFLRISRTKLVTA